MINSPVSPFSLASFLINLIISIASFYAAWANLSKRQISKFGFDAMLLAIAQTIDKKQVAKIREDPKVIHRIGIMMILFGIGSLYIVITKLIEGF